MRGKLLTGALIAAVAGATTAAKAAVILTLGQVGGINIITGTANSPVAGQTTISATAQAVTITQIFGNVPTVNPALLTLTATSTDNAQQIGNTFLQHYAGSFSVTSGVSTALAGTFTDALFGSGTGLTLTASNGTAGENVTFNSTLIPASALGNPLALSFSFSNVTPAVSTIGTGCAINPATTPCTLNSFTAAVSATFSANAVTGTPEPASLALLGTGLVGLAAVIRRRRRTS